MLARLILVSAGLLMAVGFAPAQELKPARLAQDKVEMRLEGMASDVAVAGGGRFILFYVPEARKIQILDLMEPESLKAIATPDDRVFMAGGLDKIMVILGNSALIQRYKLPSLEREVSRALPIKNWEVSAACMGSAARGPLLVNGKIANKETTIFLDTLNFTIPPFTLAANKKSLNWAVGEPVRASANGRVFGSWNPGSSPQGLRLLTLVNTQIRETSEHKSAGHVSPGPDGKVVYTARGLYSSDLKFLTKGMEERNNIYAIPPAEGNEYYLTAEDGKLNIHLIGDDRPLVTWTDLDLPKHTNWDRERFNADKRIILVPAAQVLVTVPDAHRIMVYKFDVAKLLERSGTDYIVVVSKPPPSVRRGAEFKYKLEVRSNKGDFKFRMEKGPKGMTVNNDGEVYWKPDISMVTGVKEVIVAVKNSAGQEFLHHFTFVLQQ